MVKALAELTFYHSGKTILWKQATVTRFHYVRYGTSSEVWDCWWIKADGDAQ
jgi:hypothetical protein